MSEPTIMWLIANFVVNGMIGTWYLWAVYSDKYKQYRIRTPEVERITLPERMKVIAYNMPFSILLYVVALYLFADNWIYYEEASLLTIFGESLAVLLVYDFIYYWFHRIFHRPELMKLVHGVHHKMRYPTAWDGLYLSPAENFAGLAILFIAFSIFAPIHETSFLFAVFFHTLINIVVHTNMVLPHPIFKLFNFWAVKHDIHHGKHLDKNYANIFPYWDMMFNTYK